MTTLELVQNYPDATNVVREWFVNKMMESIKESDAPEEFKQMMRDQGIDDDRLVAMMDASPRLLLDVLDQNDVIIQINAGKVFSYSINEGEVIAGGWNNRREAERAAIEQAFIMLDAKMKSNEG